MYFCVFSCPSMVICSNQTARERVSAKEVCTFTRYISACRLEKAESDKLQGANVLDR